MSKNAVDEFLGMKKKATGPWSNFGTNFQHAAAGGLAAAAVGVGVAGVGAAAGKIFDAATKSHDFKQMLSANPDLQEHHEADPKRFNMMFSTLRTMNPEFSKDPLVAGAFMRQMHESPTGIGGIASEALKHRRDFGPGVMDDINAYAREGAKGGLTHGLNVPDRDRVHALAQAGFDQKETHHQQGRDDQAKRQSADQEFTQKQDLNKYRLQERSKARDRRFTADQNSRTVQTDEWNAVPGKEDEFALSGYKKQFRR